MIDITKPPVDLHVTPEGIQHYGALFSDDPRNHDLAAYTPLASGAAPLPQSFFANLEGIPHWNQHKLGACVGHAAGKAEQTMKFHESGAVPAAIIPFSARFLYAYSKCTDGIPTIEGTYPANVAKIMQKIGCATEATCVNDTLLSHADYTYHGVSSNIPQAIFTEASKYKISNYAFSQITETGIKAAIQFANENKGGVMMLIQVDKGMYTARDGRISWAAADILPIREPVDQATLGGHEVMPYGFDTINGRTAIYFFNSWSDAWGDKGNGWFWLDEYIAHIVQVISVFDVDPNYQADNFKYTFTKALSYKMTNSDVVALQHCLKIDGEFPATVAFTGYFGDVTFAAVKAFQAKYRDEILTPAGLTQPTGIVGFYTLKKLNSLFSPK